MQPIVFKLNNKSHAKKVFIFWLVLIFSTLNVNSQSEKTNNLLEKDLIGEHALTLQWIGWDFPGTVDFYYKDDAIVCVGEQRSRENDQDLIEIRGTINIVNEKEFLFKGIIVTKIDFINNGEECIREGEFTFKISGKRKYWRMQEMGNPCEDVVDYIDIYFKKE